MRCMRTDYIFIWINWLVCFIICLSLSGNLYPQFQFPTLCQVSWKAFEVPYSKLLLISSTFTSYLHNRNSYKTNKGTSIQRLARLFMLIDWLAKLLKEHWEELTHRHKRYLTLDDLNAGTFLGEYPSIVSGAVGDLRKSNVLWVKRN
mgnify:CR=1 FL=1